MLAYELYLANRNSDADVSSRSKCAIHYNKD